MNDLDFIKLLTLRRDNLIESHKIAHTGTKREKYRYKLDEINYLINLINGKLK